MPNPILLGQATSMTEGWARPMLSKKFHYFRDAESLCRKWMLKPPDGYEPDNGKPTADDCAACRKELNTLKV